MFWQNKHQEATVDLTVTEHNEFIREIKNQHFWVRYNAFTKTVEMQQMYLKSVTGQYNYSSIQHCTPKEAEILARMIAEVLQME